MLLVYISGSSGLGIQNMIVFLLPLRAKELGAPLPVIGLIISAGTLIPALLALGSGILIDRLGARSAFILCSACTALSTLGFAMATSFWVLGALQLLNGFIRNSAWVASQTYVSYLAPPERRTGILGRFSFSANLGQFAGPLAMGFVAEAVGYRMAFSAIALIGAVYTVLGLALPRLPAAGGSASFGAASSWRAMTGLLLGGSVQATLLLTCVRLWSPAAWQPFYQIYLQEHGFRPAIIGTVLSATFAVAVPATLAAGWIARLMDKGVATAVALALGALGVVISPYVAAIPLVYLPAILLGIAEGISLPLLIALMAEDAPSGQLGVALALRNGVNQAAKTVAPIASGAIIPRLGITLGFDVSAAIAWAALAGALWLKRLNPPTSALPNSRGRSGDSVSGDAP